MFEDIQLQYKMSIEQSESNQKIQMLKLKVEIKGLQNVERMKCFVATISSTEEVKDNSQQINFTLEQKIITLVPKSMKEDKQNKLCMLKWEIPIHHCLTETNSQEIIRYSSRHKLEICYISNNDRRQQDFILQFKKCYDVNSQQYREMYDNYFFYEDQNQSLQDAIQHELILQRSDKNKIPIALRLNSNVINQNARQKIEIKLQSLFLKDTLPQVQVFLYQKFIYEQKYNVHRQLIKTQILRFARTRQEDGQDNNRNCEVDFNLDLYQYDLPIDIAPLYLGQNIESQHILLIKIIFDKINCCFDWSQRKFDIFVPIEIIPKEINQNPQVDSNTSQNQNKTKKNYYKAQQNEAKQYIIKADICPQFCQLYQNYLKVEVLKEQSLKTF